MKLYELNRGDTFRLLENPQVPPDMHQPNLTWVYKLINIDGMYSYVKSPNKQTYHFAAWTEVEKVETT